MVIYDCKMQEISTDEDPIPCHFLHAMKSNGRDAFMVAMYVRSLWHAKNVC